MRQPRLKIDEVDTFYHCYNRVAGDPGYFPFEDAEKERFIRLIKKLSRFYTVDVVAHQVLSNHFSSYGLLLTPRLLKRPVNATLTTTWGNEHSTLTARSAQRLQLE
jgi:hypothetical protein